MTLATACLARVPTDLAPEPTPVPTAGSADWLLPALVVAVVLVVVAVAVLAVVRRRAR